MPDKTSNQDNIEEDENNKLNEINKVEIDNKIINNNSQNDYILQENNVIFNKVSEEIAKENKETINNKIPNEKEKTTSNSNPKRSIFDRIILPQIRKQIEFYFSDKNYYKDNFLLEKATEDENNCNYFNSFIPN